MDESRDVSVAEAAQLLERSTEQVRRYLREGRLSGRRIGGQWFIERAALVAFSAAQNAGDDFLSRIPPASRTDPLGRVIAVGGGGGSDISQGKAAYRQAFRWRRT
jgi:excisionase family DNA binding protein